MSLRYADGQRMMNKATKMCEGYGSLLRDFVAEWSKEPRSIVNYVNNVKVFLDSIYDTPATNKQILAVKSRDIVSFLNSKKTKTTKDGEVIECSISTRQAYYFALNKFYNSIEQTDDEALIKGWNNPMRKIAKPVGRDVVKHKLMDSTDVSKILAVAKHGQEHFNRFHEGMESRDYLILMLLCTTGLRVSELSQIQINDFDENGVLYLRTKRNQEREIVLNAKLKQALNEWLPKRKEILKSKGRENETALIINNRGGQMTIQALTYITKKYSKEAIGEAKSPHKFRSAYCSILYSKTHDIEFVRDAVGHHSTQVTGRYIVKDNNPQEEAGKILDNMFDID